MILSSELSNAHQILDMIKAYHAHIITYSYQTLLSYPSLFFLANKRTLIF